jgi:hypothetical protein
MSTNKHPTATASGTTSWDRHPDTNNALRGAPEFALLDPTFQVGTAEVAKRGLLFEKTARSVYDI